MPEGRARGHLARRAGVAPDDVVGFLAVHGRDTAGAPTLVPEGASPDRPRVPLRTLDDDEIGALLDEAAEGKPARATHRPAASAARTISSYCSFMNPVARRRSISASSSGPWTCQGLATSMRIAYWEGFSRSHHRLVSTSLRCAKCSPTSSDSPD